MAHDIIDSVGKLKAERASHVASLAPGDVLLQDLTPSRDFAWREEQERV